MFLALLRLLMFAFDVCRLISHQIDFVAVLVVVAYVVGSMSFDFTSD